MASVCAFVATCRAGDAIVVTRSSIGGHVTHHTAGAAGLFGLDICAGPVDRSRFTVDLDGLAELADRVQPAREPVGQRDRGSRADVGVRVVGSWSESLERARVAGGGCCGRTTRAPSNDSDHEPATRTTTQRLGRPCSGGGATGRRSGVANLPVRHPARISWGVASARVRVQRGPAGPSTESIEGAGLVVSSSSSSREPRWSSR
ncbi:MAG: beta-eliminating lyase family protein [Ilumatobacteraceae bacterium]|nr:beta-eliminating lyase family protein [Ilumatobacteraceae bacterium]